MRKSRQPRGAAVISLTVAAKAPKLLAASQNLS
jgi:hypothetical protein